MTAQTKSPDAPAGASRGEARRREVAEAALRVLAERGARGLTHRAVDEEAGLPQGSTSNVFRTRAALLEGALERHLSFDLAAAGPEAASAPHASREELAEMLARGVEAVVADQPALTVARYELLLESTRREELREPIRLARSRFAEATRTALAGSGCASPERHAAQLLAVLDGVVLAGLHGPEATLDRAEVTEVIRRQLADC